MGKTASYIFLAILAIVGLGSAYQMQGAADIIGKANDDLVKTKADMAKRGQHGDDVSALPSIDSSYGQPSEAEGADPQPATEFENDSGGQSEE